MLQPARQLVLIPRTSPGRLLRHAQRFLETVKAGCAAYEEREDLYRQMGTVVFAYWMAKLNHPVAIYDENREKKIMARLREGKGDWGLLCYAVDGAKRDDYLMGRDPRSTGRHDRIDVIFRNRSQVERFAELCPKFRAGHPHPLVAKYQPHGLLETPPAQD